MEGVIFTYTKNTEDVYAKLKELVGTDKFDFPHIIYFSKYAQKFIK